MPFLNPNWRCCLFTRCTAWNWKSSVFTGYTMRGSENKRSGNVPQVIRTWCIWSCEEKKYPMVTLGSNGDPLTYDTALMWWQVHSVRVASAQGARTGVSCGSTRSKKWHSLDKVSLCKNWRKSANNASGRCFRFRTLISSMRWSRSSSVETKGVSVSKWVLPSARRSLSFTSSTVEDGASCPL